MATQLSVDRSQSQLQLESVRPAMSHWRQSVWLLRRKPGAIAGIAILIVLILTALFAPWLTPYEPDIMSPTDALQAPSLAFPLGTDSFGRDQFTRLIYGGRISLMVGLISVGIGGVIGVTLGAVAGYWGSWTDEGISRFIDVMLAFPGILLALAAVAVLGPSLPNLMIAVGIATIPHFARLVRGAVLSVNTNDYVLSAEAIGCRNMRILFRHIFPNIVAPILVYATLSVGGAILSSAALNYLGMGAKPPTPEWGLMLAESRDFIRRAWWLAAFPGLAIMATVISINLLGDALRDVLDPWLKGK